MLVPPKLLFKLSPSFIIFGLFLDPRYLWAADVIAVLPPNPEDLSLFNEGETNVYYSGSSTSNYVGYFNDLLYS